MSLARALTTVRRARGASNEEPVQQQVPARTGTLKSKDFRHVDRAKISLPIELVSTTNALAYDAPDLPKLQDLMSPALSSNSSRKSYDGSDSGASSATSISTPSYSREGSPVLDSKNSYFATQQQKVNIDIPQTPFANSFAEIEIAPTTPAVPSRALSHTKQTHQALARKRSMTRLSSELPTGPNSKTSSKELAPIEPHPFGAELAQVKEVAEEFGVKDNQIWDEEEQYLVDNGFGRFSAEDYMEEIQPLFVKAFYDAPISNTSTWL